MSFKQIKNEMQAQKDAQIEKEKEKKEAYDKSKKDILLLTKKGLPYLKTLDPHFWKLAKDFKNIINRKITFSSKKLFGLISMQNDGEGPFLLVNYGGIDRTRAVRIELKIGVNCLEFYGTYGYVNDSPFCSHVSHFGFDNFDSNVASNWLEKQFEELYYKYNIKKKECEEHYESLRTPC